MPDRDPVPLCPPAEPITGDSHARLIEPLGALASELGYTTRFEALEGSADGWCDPSKSEIVVNDTLAPNAQVRVLAHELAHALGLDYERYGRERCEVLVDTATYIVCGSVGLDVSGESVPYVAGWGGEDAVSVIREYAEAIDVVARRIEKAIAADEQTGEEEAARAAA